jgi:hypothetical protein
VGRVFTLVEVFDVKMPALDLRKQVDAATADHIANDLPQQDGAQREAMLGAVPGGSIGGFWRASRTCRPG